MWKAPFVGMLSLFAISSSAVGADDELEFRHLRRVVTVNSNEWVFNSDGTLFQIGSLPSVRFKVRSKTKDNLPERVRIELTAAGKRESISSASFQLKWREDKDAFSAVVRNPFPDPVNPKFGVSLPEGRYSFEITVDLNEEVSIIFRKVEFEVRRLNR